MKSCAIFDGMSDKKQALGYLFYFEKANAFVIELDKEISEWDAPLLFQGFVKKKIYTIPKDIAMLWVRERIIPIERQNIGSILRNARLNAYNEMMFLALSKGKCSQDSCYVENIAYDDIPQNIRDRMKLNVTECFASDDKRIICLFRDNSVRVVDLEALRETYRDVAYILSNDRLLNSVKTGVGGYSIVFDDAIEIAVSDLRKYGVLLPLGANDFQKFVQMNLVDTTKACEMLDCSRQNLSYLVRNKKITPIYQGTKENLYTRGAVERIKNEDVPHS